MNSNVPEHMRDPKCAGCPKPATASGGTGGAGGASCYDKYCDPTSMSASNMCPSEDFTQCVLANTKFLQVKSSVPALLQELSSAQNAISKYASTMDARRALKQQILLMVPTCEELCKKM